MTSGGGDPFFLSQVIKLRQYHGHALFERAGTLIFPDGMESVRGCRACLRPRNRVGEEDSLHQERGENHPGNDKHNQIAFLVRAVAENAGNRQSHRQGNCSAESRNQRHNARADIRATLLLFRTAIHHTNTKMIA